VGKISTNGGLRGIGVILRRFWGREGGVDQRPHEKVPESCKERETWIAASEENLEKSKILTLDDYI
jgi:hypothetical protein